MIISVAGLKGGSGKSTISICLAAEWTARGHSVLLVDADPQGTSTAWGEVAAEAGGPTPTVVAMGEGLHHPDQLPRLSRAYDVVVVDCPPRLDKVHRAAMAVADLVLLPCSPSVADVWALEESVDLVERVQVLRPDLLAFVVVNRAVTGSRLGREVQEALTQFDIPVLKTTLGSRVDYAMAMGVGRGAGQYRAGAARVEIGMLADELEGALQGEEEVSYGPTLDQAQNALSS